MGGAPSTPKNLSKFLLVEASKKNLLTIIDAHRQPPWVGAHGSASSISFAESLVPVEALGEIPGKYGTCAACRRNSRKIQNLRRMPTKFQEKTVIAPASRPSAALSRVSPRFAFFNGF